MGLAKVEATLFSDSKVYDKDGIVRLLQDAASIAATTGRADLADSAVGRTILKAFVALEGRDAMKELSQGNMDALADFVETPANQRLAAKELLKSAKSVDPNYERPTGMSL